MDNLPLLLCPQPKTSHCPASWFDLNYKHFSFSVSDQILNIRCFWNWENLTFPSTFAVFSIYFTLFPIIFPQMSWHQNHKIWHYFLNYNRRNKLFNTLVIGLKKKLYVPSDEMIIGLVVVSEKPTLLSESILLLILLTNLNLIRFKHADSQWLRLENIENFYFDHW